MIYWKGCQYLWKLVIKAQPRHKPEEMDVGRSQRLRSVRQLCWEKESEWVKPGFWCSISRRSDSSSSSLSGELALTTENQITLVDYFIQWEERTVPNADQHCVQNKEAGKPKVEQKSDVLSPSEMLIFYMFKPTTPPDKTLEGWMDSKTPILSYLKTVGVSSASNRFLSWNMWPWHPHLRIVTTSQIVEFSMPIRYLDGAARGFIQ